ncbi:MAG TPA: XVIPCD domain-containing protein [Pseudoxanthomonas sp.]|nr:XVIPCD domain-containing protein [Pseudoxanthomonas sp.]
MPTLSSQAQAIVTAFGQQPGVTQDQVNNLRAVIYASPLLVAQVNNAVAAGHLKQLAPLPHANAGGEYDAKNKTIRLPLAMLTSPPPGAPPFNAGEPTFVLGHELQHGFNHTAKAQAYRDFFHEAVQKAQEPILPRDYTAATAKLIAANRRDEAAAEIAGWNAVVDRVRSTNATPTIGDIYKQNPTRLADFVDRTGNHPNFTYNLKPNLTLNPDLTLSATPANLEAMGVNYFDKAPVDTQLGHHGNSDYANYYGAYAVGVAAQLDRHYNPPQQGVALPQMALDLSQLRLNEKLMEENGINLGSNTRPMPYYDSGVHPPTAGLFQHTANSHRHVSPVAAQAFELELEKLREKGAGARAVAPGQGHPDYDLYRQIRGGVEKLDAEHGRSWDAVSDRMAASLLVLAKENGLQRVDHVVLSWPNGTTQHGEKVFVMQGGVDEPARLLASMKTQDALQVPQSQSFERLEAFNQQQAREQALVLSSESQRRALSM